MGEGNSHSGFTCQQVVHLSTMSVLLLLFTVFFTAETQAISVVDESALKQRLPVSMKVTAIEVKSRISHWQTFIESVRHKSEAEKITAVNVYFNALHFIEDANLWHKPDYWATPLQVLAAGAGDCEDFAIAKYFTLKTLGITNEHLRITYVWNNDTQSGKREPHMVLTYATAANTELLVLDILTNDIQTLAQRKGLELVYGLNSEGLWLAGDNALTIPAGSPLQLSQWRQLSQAMENDAALLQMQ